MENNLIKNQNQMLSVLSDISTAVLNGNLDAFEVYVRFDEIEKHLKLLTEKINEMAVTEAEKYKGQSFMGYMVEVSQKTNYKYEHIPEWVELKNKIKEVEEKAKNIAKASGGIDLIGESTGEIMSSAKVSYSKPYITLKKTK